MAGVGPPFYRVASTDFRCVRCGVSFEVYWSELDGGKPAEAKAVCPLSGCDGDARPVKDSYVVDFRRLGERLERIERLIWPPPIVRSNSEILRNGLQVLVRYRSPLRLGILEALSHGPARYSDLRKGLGTYDPPLLRALRALKEAGLIRKGSSPPDPYEITEEGRHVHDEAFGLQLEGGTSSSQTEGKRLTG